MRLPIVASGTSVPSWGEKDKNERERKEPRGRNSGSSTSRSLAILGAAQTHHEWRARLSDFLG